MANALLLENGTELLLEDGTPLLLEGAATVTPNENALLLEDGTPLLLEDGGQLLLESDDASLTGVIVIETSAGLLMIGTRG